MLELPLKDSQLKEFVNEIQNKTETLELENDIIKC